MKDQCMIGRRQIRTIEPADGIVEIQEESGQIVRFAGDLQPRSRFRGWAASQQFRCSAGKLRGRRDRQDNRVGFEAFQHPAVGTVNGQACLGIGGVRVDQSDAGYHLWVKGDDREDQR